METTQIKQYLIVGGVAGGASIAARLRRLDENAEITMLERGQDVSFSNCALPYFLGGEVAESDALRLISPRDFYQKYRIRALPLHEALRIDRENKSVQVRKTDTGEETEMAYDTLFLSPGAAPIMPGDLPGIKLPKVFSVRNVRDVERIDEYLKTHRVKEVAVIGGGFIGLEVAENLHKAGYAPSVIDMAPQVMLPFDAEMAAILHKEIMDQGIPLILGDGLAAITQEGVTLASGRAVMAQAVIMAIGVRPETGLAKEAGLEIGATGGILVDENMRTSDPDIYAVGDAVEVTSRISKKPTRLALAGPALRQARAAANAALGVKDAYRGVFGASVIRVFHLNAASVGYNERQCRKEGVDYGVSFVIPADRVSIMPGAMPMFFKLIYEKGSGTVLGAQAIGQGEVDRRIDVIATLMRFSGTIRDLADLELTYAPVFSTVRDVVSQAALAACAQEDGLVRQVMFTEVRALAEKGAYILDVREQDEFEYGHIKGAANIPLSALRERLDEIPRDKPVYVHCRTGQRSYNAARVLTQCGFGEVYNIAGSFLALSWAEAYEDSVSGREPLVTQYNFW